MKKQNTICKRYMLVFFCAGLIILAFINIQTINSAPPAKIPSSGYAWKKLEPKVDKLVEDLIRKENLPGMTVAISKNGRLILTKGYGMANIKNNKAMKHNMRSNIGSTTKATVTGPAVWQLMKKKGINPKTKKLYGSGGVFGNTYSAKIQSGIKRHTPIVAMAIDPNNRVYAWYSDGTVSSGTSSDLDRHSKPVRYTLPAGKKPVDIRAIAIAKTGKVFVWYDAPRGKGGKGTRSIGTITDLDRHSSIGKCDANDESGCVTIAKGKTMIHIVGIGIAKSNDHVYIWYEDGTVSSGTSMDFDHYFKPKRYETAGGSGGTSYNIRGIGIAKNDHVYAWYINGKASSGTSTKLYQYRNAYPYSFPAFRTNKWSKWYREITIQNLLDHTAGFTRSGDTKGAMRLNKKSENTLTYDHVHKHFLLTRKLLYQPGTSSSYSNHGFGMMRLVIEKLSGKSYLSYAKNDYLKPMGLHNNVRPQSKNIDPLDAWGHSYPNGDKSKKPQPIAFKNSTLGLAAGGFKASAQDLTKIMVKLNRKYSISELDKMGWGKNNSDVLSHNGLTGGGTSYVVMFPPGYKSKSTGGDLGGVNIAIITNIRTSTGKLKNLANKIARQVPGANVSQSYNIWKGKPTRSKPKPTK